MPAGDLQVQTIADNGSIMQISGIHGHGRRSNRRMLALGRHVVCIHFWPQFQHHREMHSQSDKPQASENTEMVPGMADLLQEPEPTVHGGEHHGVKREIHHAVEMPVGGMRGV